MDLKEYFQKNPEVAIAFSGGVDSAYLLYAANKYCEKVKAYYVQSEFQPYFEKRDALKLTKLLNTDIEIIHKEILANENIAGNPADRCYHCKKEMFSSICESAYADGFKLVIDGTNASDEESDRPGTRAKIELSVESPLKTAGLTKEKIRILSKEAGLFTWDKPSYSCLATRIASSSEITQEKLNRIEVSECYMSTLGFKDFRVRDNGDRAKLEIRGEDFMLLFKYREEIYSELKKYYSSITVDLEARN